MTVQVIGQKRMVSDVTLHQAICVGEGWWESSYLPGRKLTVEQATAAMRAAEEAEGLAQAIAGGIARYASDLGLTPLEAFGLASRRCTWPAPMSSSVLSRRRSFGRRGGVL